MRTRLAALVALALVVAGCGRRTEVNVNVDTTGTAASPDPVPAAPPDSPGDTSLVGGPATTPIPDTAWVVTADGLGPVRVGMAESDALARLGINASDVQRTEGSTCAYVQARERRPGVAYMLSEGTVARVDVDAYIGMGEGQQVPPGRLPKTAEGVGVGSTEADVRRTYGATVRAEPHHYVDGGRYLYVPVADTARQALVFETDATGVVTSMRAGRRPEAEWVEGCS